MTTLVRPVPGECTTPVAVGLSSSGSATTPAMPVIEDWAFTEDSSGTVLAMTAPSGITAGDLLILAPSWYYGAGPSFSAPGFTAVPNAPIGSGAGACSGFLYKVATGSEGTVNVTHNSGAAHGVYYRISGQNDSWLNAYDEDTDFTGTAHTTEGSPSRYVTTTQNNCLVLTMYTYGVSFPPVVMDTGPNGGHSIVKFDNGVGPNFGAVGTHWFSLEHSTAGNIPYITSTTTENLGGAWSQIAIYGES